MTIRPRSRRPSRASTPHHSYFHAAGHESYTHTYIGVKERSHPKYRGPPPRSRERVRDLSPTQPAEPRPYAPPRQRREHHPFRTTAQTLTRERNPEVSKTTPKIFSKHPKGLSPHRDTPKTPLEKSLSAAENSRPAKNPPKHSHSHPVFQQWTFRPFTLISIRDFSLKKRESPQLRPQKHQFPYRNY